MRHASCPRWCEGHPRGNGTKHTRALGQIPEDDQSNSVRLNVALSARGRARPRLMLSAQFAEGGSPFATIAVTRPQAKQLRGLLDTFIDDDSLDAA